MYLLFNAVNPKYYWFLQSMPLQDLFDIIQNIAVSRSRANNNQPATIISTSAKTQQTPASKAPASGSEISPGEKTPPKDKKAKKAPRKSSTGNKPMPATSGALAAAMMAATAVAGGSKFFDETQVLKKPDEVSATASKPVVDSSADAAADASMANTSDGKCHA
jgi:hypothetical protein